MVLRCVFVAEIQMRYSNMHIFCAEMDQVWGINY